MYRILFLCHGNICRSPMAEVVMRDLVARAGLTDKIQVASAATSGEEVGNPVYQPARRMIEAHGLSCVGKRAARMTRQDYQVYDLLVYMDRRNLKWLLQICGADPQDKMRRLLDFTDSPHDVVDPWFSGDFQTAWDEIGLGCRALLEQLRKHIE